MAQKNSLDNLMMTFADLSASNKGKNQSIIGLVLKALWMTIWAMVMDLWKIVNYTLNSIFYSLGKDTLAGEKVWPVSFWLVTLWPEWHFSQFFCFLWGDQKVKKNSKEGTQGKNLKKIIIAFGEKGYFFKTFPYGAPYVYSPFGTPKEAKKNLSKCLAKV